MDIIHCINILFVLASFAVAVTGNHGHLQTVPRSTTENPNTKTTGMHILKNHSDISVSQSILEEAGVDNPNAEYDLKPDLYLRQTTLGDLDLKNDTYKDYTQEDEQSLATTDLVRSSRNTSEVNAVEMESVNSTTNLPPSVCYEEHESYSKISGFGNDMESSTSYPKFPEPKGYNLSLSPSLDGPVRVFAGEMTVLFLDLTCHNCKEDMPLDNMNFGATIERSSVAIVVNYTMEQLQNNSASVSVLVQGIFLGKTLFNFNVTNSINNSNVYTTLSYPIHTLRPKTFLDTIFFVIVSILVGFNTIAYACMLDLQVVKEYIKKPVGVIIGFVCQYGIMPVSALCMAWLFQLEDSLAFGLLCYGASPGGGASNMWTILLRGDINLSVSMTFFSLLSSLAMTSLWVFTLGRRFTDGASVPFKNIFLSLAILMATVIIGLCLKQWLPKVALKLTKIIKPMSAVIIVYILTVGTYTNLYIFMMMNSWRVVISAMMVSYIGYIVSLALALLCRRSWKDTKTIVIETGIQNGGLAMVMVRYSLPDPDGDLATVAPATAMMTNGLPLIIAALIMCMYRYSKGKPVLGSKKTDKKLENDIEDKNPKISPTLRIPDDTINSSLSVITEHDEKIETNLEKPDMASCIHDTVLARLDVLGLSMLGKGMVSYIQQGGIQCFEGGINVEGHVNTCISDINIKMDGVVTDSHV